MEEVSSCQKPPFAVSEYTLWYFAFAYHFGKTFVLEESESSTPQGAIILNQIWKTNMTYFKVHISISRDACSNPKRMRHLQKSDEASEHYSRTPTIISIIIRTSSSLNYAYSATSHPSQHEKKLSKFHASLAQTTLYSISFLFFSFEMIIAEQN